MSGPYDSCVGLRSDIAIKRFMLATPHKYELASEEVKISAVVVGVDTETGHATSIERILYPEFPTKREFSDERNTNG
jgi:calcineurin-like phosphoesterase